MYYKILFLHIIQIIMYNNLVKIIYELKLPKRFLQKNKYI